MTFAIDSAGYIPDSLDVVRQRLIDRMSRTHPELDMTLPAELVSGLLDTSIYAIDDIQSLVTDLINSFSPYSANSAGVAGWATALGLTQNELQRTSVYVTFFGKAGFVISEGDIVSDGDYQYRVMKSAIIDSSGSAICYCVATTDGSWAVPENTVTQIVTIGYDKTTITVNNLTDGFVGSSAETVAQLRARVFIALQQTSCSSNATALRLLSEIVPDPRLISLPRVGSAYKVIVGGGDPFLIAHAIYASGLDISRLAPSMNHFRNIFIGITDKSNSYTVNFVIPFAQKVEIDLRWNSALSFVSEQAIAEATIDNIAQYINSLSQSAGINLLVINSIFNESIKPIIDFQNLISISISIKLDGVTTHPSLNSSIIDGDPEGYFYTDRESILVTRG